MFNAVLETPVTTGDGLLRQELKQTHPVLLDLNLKSLDLRNYLVYHSAL